MALQLIFGSCGAGKTTYMLQDIIKKSLQYPEQNYLILVPEQFTMETQKNIITLHPKGGSFNIDVLSFLRLAGNVFEQMGVHTGTILDDTGKSLVLRKVVRREKNALSVFGAKTAKEGFIEEMKSVLSELYQYGMDAQQLQELCGSASVRPLLRAKLQDVATIFQAFQDYIGKDYIPSEEILKELCAHISESQWIQNSEIYLDGYTGFTPIQYQLLGLLMRYSKKVTISLTLPADKVYESRMLEQELFLLSIKTKERLLHIAAEGQIPIEDPIVLGEQCAVRFIQSPSLAFLEQHIFRYKTEVYRGGKVDVELYAAANPKDEMAAVIRNIHRLVQEEGYRYREIAIVTGDMEMYYRIAQRELGNGQIPCFIDHKRSILANPFVEFIRSAIQVLEQDFSYEAVFRYLKIGLTDICHEEIDRLENMILAMGLRGYQKWSEDWEKVPEQINSTRRAVLEQFQELREAIGKGTHTVCEFTTKLYEFLERGRIEEKINHFVNQFQEEGELAMVREYGQVYPLVMDLFDKMVELMGEEEISLEEYAQILDSGFEEIKVGIIPPSMDCVTVGDIQRTRLNQIRALFIVGVNDGIIPKSGKNSGILTEHDRRELENLNVELAPTARENAFIQKFYLYLNMTKPSNRLYLSYTQMDHDGKSMRPSYLIHEIRKLYPGIKWNTSGEHQGIDALVSEDAAFSYLADQLREADRTKEPQQMNPVFLELYQYFSEMEDYRDKIHGLVEAAAYRYEDNPIDQAVAQALYGGVMKNSISRLEKFASCAYSHFLTYGLFLKERKIYEVKVSDIGTIYHAAIEIFSKLVNESYSWPELEESVRRELVEQSVAQAIAQSETDAVTGTARNQYMMERVSNMTDKTTQVLCSQIKKGKFKPSYFELEFSPQTGADSMCMQINDETEMHLRGVVDRVDLYRESDEAGNVKRVYVKIIDYKSGHKDFKIQDVEDGRQLQLSMYMCAVADMEQKKYPEAVIVPAAELYYNIKNPYIDKYNEDGEDDSEQRRLYEYKMPGLVNNDEHILEVLDRDIIQEGTSTVISVSRTKDGTLKLPNGTSTVGFEKLGDFVKEKAKELGERILKGDVSIQPYKDGTKNACTYCEYSSVCRFDTEIEGFAYRNVQKQKPEEIWDRIIQEQEVDQDGKYMDETTTDSD